MKRTLRTVIWLTLGIACHASILAVQSPPTIAREYFTPFGTLTLSVSGSEVRGRYPHEKRTLAGKLDGHELQGSWRQDDGSGSIIVTFSEDFSSFKARYNRVETPDKWQTGWDGMGRPALQVRQYKTTWGTLGLNVEGSQVEGSYPWFNGKVLGELRGTEFKGIWLQSNGGIGTLNLTFNDDFSSFKGRYNDFNYKPERWGEWNGQLKM
jgi:hypothetical protein